MIMVLYLCLCCLRCSFVSCVKPEEVAVKLERAYAGACSETVTECMINNPAVLRLAHACSALASGESYVMAIGICAFLHCIMMWFNFLSSCFVAT